MRQAGTIHRQEQTITHTLFPPADTFMWMFLLNSNIQSLFRLLIKKLLPKDKIVYQHARNELNTHSTAVFKCRADIHTNLTNRNFELDFWIKVIRYAQNE